MANQQLLTALKEYLDEQLVVLYPNVEKRPTDMGICFTASKLAVKILRRLGYDCKEQRVFVIGGNKRGKEIFLEQTKTGKFDIDEITKDGGWTIGVGSPDKSSDSCHYIIFFTKDNEIMDITWGQAKREKRYIFASAYWCKENELPETILQIMPVKSNINWELGRDWYYPQFKTNFKRIIEEGYKQLKHFKERKK